MQTPFEIISFNIINDKYLSSSEILFISILFQYNLRFAELKHAKWNLFFPSKYLLLEGCKHSNNICIRDRAILKQINELEMLDPIFIFPTIKYSRIYSIIKSRYSHLLPHLPNHKNQPVTHSSRYNAVSVDLNPEFNKIILRHKSVRTQNYYLNKKIISNR